MSNCCGRGGRTGSRGVVPGDVVFVDVFCRDRIGGDRSGAHDGVGGTGKRFTVHLDRDGVLGIRLGGSGFDGKNITVFNFVTGSKHNVTVLDNERGVVAGGEGDGVRSLGWGIFGGVSGIARCGNDVLGPAVERIIVFSGGIITGGSCRSNRHSTVLNGGGGGSCTGSRGVIPDNGICIDVCFVDRVCSDLGDAHDGVDGTGKRFTVHLDRDAVLRIRCGGSGLDGKNRAVFDLGAGSNGLPVRRYGKRGVSAGGEGNGILIHGCGGFVAVGGGVVRVTADSGDGIGSIDVRAVAPTGKLISVLFVGLYGRRGNGNRIAIVIIILRGKHGFAVLRVEGYGVRELIELGIDTFIFINLVFAILVQSNRQTIGREPVPAFKLIAGKRVGRRKYDSGAVQFSCSSRRGKTLGNDESNGIIFMLISIIDQVAQSDKIVPLDSAVSIRSTIQNVIFGSDKI